MLKKNKNVSVDSIKENELVEGEGVQSTGIFIGRHWVVSKGHAGVGKGIIITGKGPYIIGKGHYDTGKGPFALGKGRAGVFITRNIDEYIIPEEKDQSKSVTSFDTDASRKYPITLDQARKRALNRIKMAKKRRLSLLSEDE